MGIVVSISGCLKTVSSTIEVLSVSWLLLLAYSPQVPWLANSRIRSLKATQVNLNLQVPMASMQRGTCHMSLGTMVIPQRALQRLPSSDIIIQWNPKNGGCTVYSIHGNTRTVAQPSAYLMRTAPGSLSLHDGFGHDKHVGGQALKWWLHELESIFDQVLSGQLSDLTVLQFVNLESDFSTVSSWGFDEGSMY